MKYKHSLAIVLVLVLLSFFFAGLKIEDQIERVKVQDAMVRYDDTGWGWAELKILSSGKYTTINSVDLIDSKEVWMILEPGDVVTFRHYWLGWKVGGTIWEWSHYDKLTE